MRILIRDLSVTIVRFWDCPMITPMWNTLGIARSFLEGLKNYKLDTVVEAMGCTLANHHRAVDDAGATADVFVRFLERFKKKNIRDLDELNTYSAMSVDAIKKLKTYHIILLAKNEIGRINLYRLVSLSHLVITRDVREYQRVCLQNTGRD